VGYLEDCMDSLVGALTTGNGGSGASGIGDSPLLLENLRAWPKLPLLRRRLAKDNFLFKDRPPACSIGVCGRETGDGTVDVYGSILILC